MKGMAAIGRGPYDLSEGVIYGIGLPAGMRPEDAEAGGHVFLLIPLWRRRAGVCDTKIRVVPSANYGCTRAPQSGSGHPSAHSETSVMPVPSLFIT